MIIIHNGKTIGVNVELVKKYSEREFIKLYKNNNAFTDNELASIFKEIKEIQEK